MAPIDWYSPVLTVPSPLIYQTALLLVAMHKVLLSLALKIFKVLHTTIYSSAMLALTLFGAAPVMIPLMAAHERMLFMVKLESTQSLTLILMPQSLSIWVQALILEGMHRVIRSAA